jgi:hypothetical protein
VSSKYKLLVHYISGGCLHHVTLIVDCRADGLSLLSFSSIVAYPQLTYQTLNYYLSRTIQSTFHLCPNLGLCSMRAQRDSSTITRWEVLSGQYASCETSIRLPLIPNVLSASQSSSSSSNKSPSDLGRVDLTLMGSSSKRKATLSPEGAARPQKLARTDTSHRPETSVMENEVLSRSRLFGARVGIVSPTTTKTAKKKVCLKRNHELVHSLVKSGYGTSNILSMRGCRWLIVAR